MASSSPQNNSKNDPALSAILAVNLTTSDWGFEPLPSNVTAINGTVPQNGTFINGDFQNKTIINGTYLIERTTPQNIGSVSLVSFIYMVMSLVIILLAAPDSIKWIKAANGERTTSSTLSITNERNFNAWVQKRYPQTPKIAPADSYAETVARVPDQAFTSKDLQDCIDLIRAKYSLDVQTHNLKDIYAANRPIVDDMRRQAAGALVDLKRMVEGWMAAGQENWSQEEWRLINEIYNRYFRSE
jgi:hypothetical protein